MLSNLICVRLQLILERRPCQWRQKWVYSFNEVCTINLSFLGFSTAELVFCTKKKEERPPGLSPTDGLWPVCDTCNNARDYNTVKLLFDAYSEAITITDKHCGNTLTLLEYVLEGEGILHWYVDEQSKVINFLETQLDLIEDNVSTTTITTHGWLSLSLH